MFEKKFKLEDIKSAHEKYKRKMCHGEGGIVFTEDEQAILDSHLTVTEEGEVKNAFGK